MAKYCNVDTLLEFVKNNTPTIEGQTTLQCVERAIKEAPTADVVEVVRCGNCLNRIKGTYPKCAGRKPDEYCSDGLRKE